MKDIEVRKALIEKRKRALWRNALLMLVLLCVYSCNVLRNLGGH